MENLAVQLILGALLGGFLGNLRSRHLATDLIFLGIWVVFFLMNPGYFLGAAIGGYLLGWGYRCHRLAKTNSTEDKDGNDSDNIF